MNLKEKLQGITSKPNSNWLKKAQSRSSKRWLKVYSSEIARRVLFVLKEKDMNQLDLAKTLNVKPQQVSKIVKGQENLTLETIYKLSEALDFQLITFPTYAWNASEKFKNDFMPLSDKPHNNHSEISDKISVVEGSAFWTIQASQTYNQTGFRTPFIPVIEDAETINE